MTDDAHATRINGEILRDLDGKPVKAKAGTDPAQQREYYHTVTALTGRKATGGSLVQGQFTLPPGVTVPKSNADPLGTITRIPQNLPGVRARNLQEPHISEAVIEPLRKAGAAAAKVPAKEGGPYHLVVTSAYRNIEHQRVLWEEELREHNGNERAARKWCAPPGRSAHHTGGAIDVRLVDAQGRSSGDKVEGKDRKRHYTKQARILQGVLQRIMLDQGWTRYHPEHWHFEYGTPRWNRGPGTVQP